MNPSIRFEGPYHTWIVIQSCLQIIELLVGLGLKIGKEITGIFWNFWKLQIKTVAAEIRFYCKNLQACTQRKIDSCGKFADIPWVSDVFLDGKLVWTDCVISIANLSTYGHRRKYDLHLLAKNISSLQLPCKNFMTFGCIVSNTSLSVLPRFKWSWIKLSSLYVFCFRAMTWNARWSGQ